MAEAKKIGELLKAAGLIDDFQLETALSHQRNWGGKLGSVLIELDFLREEDLARVIAEKLHTPYLNLFEPGVPQAVIRLIKPDVAKKYQVVPVKKEKGELIIAMSDPLDIEAIDAIRFVTGLNIRPSLALESEIRDAIKKYYDGEEVVRKKHKVAFHQRPQSSDKMEIIRGSDLKMQTSAGADPDSSILSRDDTTQQTLADMKLRFDALISLLIEEGVITREKLVSMLYQKKIGL
jgi:hypothetical protein